MIILLMYPSELNSLSSSDNARGVIGASFIFSSEKRTPGSISKNSMRRDHLDCTNRLALYFLALFMSSEQKGAIVSPSGVRTYSGRNGCPCPGLCLISPLPTSLTSVEDRTLRLIPSRFIIVTNRAPSRSNISPRMGMLQRK